MHHFSKHQPYDLTTSFGRAQSYAHSLQGAYLVNLVETVLQEAAEDNWEELEKLIAGAEEQAQPNCLADSQLLDHLSIFKTELGKRDRAEFEPLYAAYSEERQVFQQQLQILTDLVEAVKLLFRAKISK